MSNFVKNQSRAILFYYAFTIVTALFSRYFCETLLDFHDPCPVKEQLRNKIVGRLLKEGSNADEPANIALSDYSSLSSGCESSSCDEDVVKNNKNADGDDEEAEEAIAAAEERKRIRKLRSRRDRSKNGAQFTQTLYPDFRQVSSLDKILFFLSLLHFSLQFPSALLESIT